MIRKEAGLFFGSFLPKGEVFAYVRLFQNLKDLKGCLGDGQRIAERTAGAGKWTVLSGPLS